MIRFAFAAFVAFSFATVVHADGQALPTMVSLTTGSQVATWTIPALVKARKTPVLFLHGGPGMYTTEAARKNGAALRTEGFTTVYFDQAGGGLSSRIPAVQYTMQRAVDDVEALRIALKLDKVVLWGNSYGASLAALYARRFPDRVAGMILTSPGMFPGYNGKRNYGLTDRGNIKIGAALTKAIGQIDRLGGAAEPTISQDIAGKLMDELVAAELMNGMVCKGANSPPVVGGGGNLYSNRMLSKALKRMPLALGSPLGKPVLILRGTCDFIPMDSAERFRAALGGTIVSIPNAGHQFVENAAAVDAALTQYATTELAAIE